MIIEVNKKFRFINKIGKIYTFIYKLIHSKTNKYWHVISIIFTKHHFSAE